MKGGAAGSAAINSGATFDIGSHESSSSVHPAHRTLYSVVPLRNVSPAFAPAETRQSSSVSTSHPSDRAVIGPLYCYGSHGLRRERGERSGHYRHDTGTADIALRSLRKRITCPCKSLVCCWIGDRLCRACPIAAALEIAPAKCTKKEITRPALAQRGPGRSRPSWSAPCATGA